MDSSSEIFEFQTKIEEYLANILTLNSDFSKKKGKDIHDNVWGTTYYYEWEIALLDLPLLQRLRSIHQTGLAFLVYPTATHTRFDHTLGVVAVVDKLIDNINKKSGSVQIENDARYTLRLAALLHDIGHGPFSHVSENVFEKMPEFLKLKKWINDKYHVTPKAHEILSFMIVSSNKFAAWFDSKIRVDNDKIKQVNIERIAEYIIGYSKDPEEKYLSDIINGPMDTDKLDYLARDAKFSGLTIGYDINRYFKTIDIFKRKFDSKIFNRLGVPLSGVNSLEQINISKMMLYPSFYHHQKVRCAERMFELLCENIINGKPKKNSKLKLNHPLDFLNYVDSDFINFSTSIDSDNFVKTNPAINIHQCLCKRDLMKRAIIISNIFIKNKDNYKTKIGYKKLMKDCHENDLELRKKIAEEVNKIIKKESGDLEKISENEIILDFPTPLNMEESLSTMVSTGSDDDEPKDIEIGDIIPIKQWAEGYNAVKLRGHIFCPSNLQIQVNKAARKVLMGLPYNILFEKTATEHCHIDYHILEEEKQAKLIC